MRIGELFLLGLESENLHFLKTLARDFGLGGLILFQRNFPDPDRLRQELADLKAAAQSELIIAVDQEGGSVNRLEEVIPTFPSARHYAEEDDFEGLMIYAQTTAMYLSRLQINTNLVPVCDVLTNPANHLLRNRSYGSEPGKVAAFASALVTEFHKYGIICCAKHFPGLGSAQIDPHLQTAISNDSYDRFETLHWPPFVRAMESGVDMIMTTHLQASALDPQNMATFSRIIIEEHLRHRFQFKGVAVTDDLCMGAVSHDFAAGQRAARALRAGHDLVMFCHNPADQESAFKSILDLYNEGRFDQKEIEAKLLRIHMLKEKLRR